MSDDKKLKASRLLEGIDPDPRDGLSGKKRIDILILFFVVFAFTLLMSVTEYLLFIGKIFEMNTDLIQIRFGVDLKETDFMMVTQLPIVYLINTLMTITVVYAGGQSASSMIKTSMVPTGEIKRMPYYKFVRMRFFIGAWGILVIVSSILQLKSAPVQLIDFGMVQASTGFGTSVVMYVLSYVGPKFTEGIDGHSNIITMEGVPPVDKTDESIDSPPSPYPEEIAAETIDSHLNSQTIPKE